MTTLVEAALQVRRGARSCFACVTAGAIGVLVALGLFGAGAALRVEHAVVALAWVVVLAARIVGRARAARRGTDTTRFDLEIALLLLVAAHAAIQRAGGLGSEAYPALYVLVAGVSAFGGRRVGQIWLAVAIAFEALVYFVTEGRTEPRPFALHAMLLALFGTLNAIFTQVEISRVRRRSERELRDERERVREDVRIFRLVATPTDASRADDERLSRSSVEEVHRALHFNLDLLKRTMGLHTCVLLMQDAEGRALRIVELVSDSDGIAEGPFPVGAGAVGAAFQRGVVMNLDHLRAGYTGICYYQEAAEVRAFIAVPVGEGGTVEGVLCADRVDERPFTPADEEVLAQAVTHLLRTLENERVFVQLERAKREHSVLHRASEALGAALDERAVLDAALEAAAQIAPYDFAAVAHYDATTRQHQVRRAVGAGSEQFADLRFRDNTSLAAMAVQNRHYLPYRGEFDEGSQVLYTRKANLTGMQSLLVLPLVVREVAIGTLALAARRPDAFGSGVRPTLCALSNQLAVALSNAASVRRLEELATTDGLTGCFNKRYFHEELTARLTAAERFGRQLSLLVVDLDHFKTVNDTYGHATGDIVLRELGTLLRRLGRETDVVARFGGEEFCVLCEETDARGALLLAERARAELAETAITTELGTLRVTCSIGVATYPEHARDKQELFEAADRALYAAKRDGRNRVVVRETRRDRASLAPARA